MRPRVGRSVGELLLSADTDTRLLMFDVSGDDAPAMLRTWGEVVQSAAELWHALPVLPRGDKAGGQLMAQLEAIAQGMHRSQLRQGWPGDGAPDQRLMGIAESFGAARDLVAAHANPYGGTRSLEHMRDLQAARTRVMHALYVGGHAVGLAVRDHIRDLQRLPHVEKQWSVKTRGIPRGQDALERLTAFEQLAGGYLDGGRFVGSLQGQHQDGHVGLARLSDTVARWDLQAHRTLGAGATPATLAAIARTQAMLNRTSLILVRAAAHTGAADPVTYKQQIAPAFEGAIRAQAHLAGAWGALTNVLSRKVDPNLRSVAEQLQGAMQELTYDRTTLADPTLIAQRADLRDIEPVVKLATVSGFTLACDARDIATHDTSLTAPAQAMLRLARERMQAAGPGDTDRLGDSLNAADLHHNRIRPLIGPVREILVQDTADAAGRQASASSAVFALWTPREPVAAAPQEGRHRTHPAQPRVAVGPPGPALR